MSSNSDLMYSNIINFLEEDGALCSFYDKSYFEKETDEEPVGNRGLFKSINDRIIYYHDILKYLNGEVRADITESIPVIDYNIVSNTSLLYKYNKNNNDEILSNSITSIINIDSLLTLQQNQHLTSNKEESLLNRAVMGQNAAQLFYNTTSFNKEDNYIYADYKKDKYYFYVYKGEIADYNFGGADSISPNIEPVAAKIFSATDSKSKYVQIANIGDEINEKTFIMPDNVVQLYIKKSTDNSTVTNTFKDNKFETSTVDNVIKIIGTETSPTVVIYLTHTYENINYNKLLIIRKDVDDDYNIIEDSDYKTYCIWSEYNESINTNGVFEDIQVDDRMPSYINSDMFESLKYFIKAEKIYYGKYSGIMNGQLSYPLEYEDDGKTVKYWRYYNNDSDTIDSGYEFYSGYLLNRGTFLNSPTAKTDFDKYLDPKSNFNGKMSLYFNNINSYVNSLFNNISYNDFNYWETQIKSTLNKEYMSVGALDNLYDIIDTSSFENNGVTVSYLLGINYVGKSKNMAHKAKCTIGLEYIDEAADALKTILTSYYGSYDSGYYFDKSSGVLTLDLLSGDVAYDVSFKKSWYSSTKDSCSSDGKYGDMSTNIRTQYDAQGKHCYVSYTRHYVHDEITEHDVDYLQLLKNVVIPFLGKGDATPDLYMFNHIDDLTVKLATPYDDFSKNNMPTGSSILIYPQSDSYLPQTVYLITNKPIDNLTANTDDDNYSSNNIISFCSLNYQHEDDNDIGGMISFKCNSIDYFKPSDITKVVIKDNLSHSYDYFKEGDPQGHKERTYTESITVEGTDSYIYELTVFGVGKKNSIFNFYDQSNKQIVLDSDIYIRPATYPKDYFSINQELGLLGKRYKLTTNSSYNMIQTLNNSKIVVGFPPIDSVSKIRYSSEFSSMCYNIENLFKNFMNLRLDNIKNIFKSKILSYFLDMKITSPNNSSDNLLTIKDIPSLKNCFFNLSKIISELANNNTVITVNNKVTTFNSNDYLYLAKLSNGALIDSYTIENEPSLESNEYNIQNLYKIFDFDSSKKESKRGCLTLKKTESKEIPSLEKLSQIIEKVSNIDNATIDDYKFIDSCLGNNTQMFISESNSGSTYTIPAVFSEDAFTISEATNINSDGSYDYTNSSIHKVNWEYKILEYIVENIISYAYKINPNYATVSNGKIIYEHYAPNILTLDENVKKYKEFTDIYFPTVRIFDKKVEINHFVNGLYYKNGDSYILESTSTNSNYPYPNESKEYYLLLSNGEYSRVLVSNSSDIIIDFKGLYFDSNNKPVFTSESNVKNIKLIFNNYQYGNITINNKTIENKLDGIKYYIPTDKLQDLLDYIKLLLEGNTKVSFSAGDDDVSGDSTSLYYKRYKVLNSRMNTLDGKLYLAGLTLNNMKTLTRSDTLKNNVVDSYSDSLLVIPINSMSETYWLPSQTATLSTADIDGKLYSKEVMESLRSTINDRCVLTCRSCNIKEGCPFYNEDEVVKMYTPELEYIDFSVKDNMLNLISETDFNIHSDRRKVEYSELEALHEKWASISNYTIDGIQQNYNFRIIEDEENKLSNVIGDNYDKENPQGLGWLTKSRYGTVNSNEGLKNLYNSEYDSSQLYNNQYLYNSLFIDDENTYIKYRDSNYTYDVSFDNVEKDDLDGSVKNVHYSGSVRIKIPYELDFSGENKNYEYNSNDLLFLVSDDDKDEEGNTIVPLIFLNTLDYINKYTIFDVNEIRDNTSDEILSESDVTIYPKDVAQWNVNILKGDCCYQPLCSNSDMNVGFDQYWMPKLKKKIKNNNGEDIWITLDGRSRVTSNKSPEILTSIDDVNELAVVSGKPVVGTYIDFIRNFEIKTSAICWVLDEQVDQINEALGTNMTKEQVIEKQKSTLPLMKTNLRFVLVKNSSYYSI